MPAPARLNVASSQASPRAGGTAVFDPRQQRVGAAPGSGVALAPVPASTPEAQRIGGVLNGTYRIERLIAVGGMGAVYEVLHLRLQQRFAVKILEHAIARNDEGYARFRQEAEIAASLNHSSIVQVFDFNTDEHGNPYMVMELVEGETLDTWLCHERSSIRDVLRVFEPLCSALDAAHGAGIVHRDLKPSNIMVRTRGRNIVAVKLLDFGISKMRDGNEAMTRTNVMMGTPNYMSPEQARGKAISVDATTDVFALGTILYEMLAGRRAFDGTSIPELLHAIVYEEPPRVDEVRPDVPQPLVEVVHKCLAKAQADRYPSVRAFFTAMRDALRPAPRRDAHPPVVVGGPAPSRARSAVMILGWVLSVAASAVASGMYVWEQAGGVQKIEVAPRPVDTSVVAVTPDKPPSYLADLAAPGSLMLSAGEQLYRADNRGLSYWSDPEAPAVSRPLPTAHVVTSLSRSSEGDILVGQADGTISRWDRDLRQAKSSQRPEQQPVLAAAAGGGYLAVAFADALVLYNDDSTRVLKRFPVTGEVVDLLFSRGENKGLLLAVHRDELVIYDADRRRRRVALELPAPALRAEIVGEPAGGSIDLELDLVQGDWMVRRLYRLHVRSRPRLEPVASTKL